MLTPRSNPAATVKGVEILMMDALSDDESVSTVLVSNMGAKNHTFTITVSTSVTGSLTLEASNDPAYTGIWAPLADAVDLATLGAGGQKQVRLSNISLNAFRARISTVVAGGTVSVTYLGQ